MATLVDTPLREIAKVVRSKNAGPFEITLDIIFKDRADFDAVRKSGVITNRKRSVKPWSPRCVDENAWIAAAKPSPVRKAWSSVTRLVCT